MSVVALITDFGLRDHYVAAMKGVILQINPAATLVDVSHEIPSQDLYHGAYVLRQALPYFPKETIFVCVVDPTVGSDRRILAGRYNDRVVLAPDNGVLSLLHRDGELQDLRVVENRRLFASTLSTTFHGRDIFAPLAGHLSTGTKLDVVGPSAGHIEVLEIASPHFDADGSIHGEVVIVDHFGNLITNISELDLQKSKKRGAPFEVKVGAIDVGPVRRTYSDVKPGEPLALLGSALMLEIAVNAGSAAQTLNAGRGTPVHLSY